MIVLMKCLNEENIVKRCISDFHDDDWVDRIIVIDGGSTDYTIHELKGFSKVEVYIHPWLDWYHNMEVCQSNIALSYLPKGSIAFILDFDERMTDNLKKSLSIINKEGLKYDVGFVARRTIDVFRYEDSPHAIIGEDGFPIEERQIGQFPDFQCRIIKFDPKMHWINSPHHCMWGVESEFKLSEDAYILHYEKDDYRDRQRIERKWLRNQARRKMLGLVADLFETKVKPELANYADPNYWDWRG